MTDEAKAAVASRAAWLGFVVDDLVDNCLAHERILKPQFFEIQSEPLVYSKYYTIRLEAQSGR
jgi:hypothetical protein